ncbi:MAG: PilZ domain-containing protein [Proteobacteria bacterium]|nr:PilZ domain-containing protein [Pseudomonadota bacterium]NOG59979.1 PilZ domain-containing protein [Pseudomonadota bacterium]
MNAQLQLKEKRRLKRFSAQLKVYSQINDELIGYSENLHVEGMMIVTKKPIPKDQEIDIWFGVDKEEKRLNRIFVSAYKVWESFTDNDERFYYSGLHFIAPSGDTLDKIQTLLYKLEDEKIQ